MIGLYSIAAIQSSFKVIQWINITIEWRKIFWQKKHFLIIKHLKTLKILNNLRYKRDRENLMILFYRQFFLLHSKKSILQVKIQRLRNNCRHVPSFKPFLRWKSKKKSKTGAGWALGPWVFAHTRAMWWWKLLQNSWAGKLAMLCLHVLRMLWANFHHQKQFGANLGSFWCKMAPQPKFPSGLANSLRLAAMRPAVFAACEAT